LKTASFLFLYFVFVKTILAQNLVLNPSFEETTDKFNNNTDFLGVKDWREPTRGGSVYLNEKGCKDDLKCRGFNKARSGNSCAGILLFAKQVRVIGGWSYIQGKLEKPLEEGNIYKVEFYLLQADSSPIAVNQIGVLFSKGTRKFNHTARYPGRPQVRNMTNKYFSSTSKWMHFSQKFIASGGEKFITIGNFSTIEKTPYMVTDENFWKRNGILRPNLLSASYTLEAFYFIDDVSVSNTDLIKGDSRLASIYFDKNNWNISQQGLEKLKNINTLKLDNAKNFKIRVEGFTDKEGNDNDNESLSDRRAKAVANKLIEIGMPPSRIHVVAYGETKAKTQNDKTDRRVDIFLELDEPE